LLFRRGAGALEDAEKVDALVVRISVGASAPRKI
jgi:hypothetical protein